MIEATTIEKIKAVETYAVGYGFSMTIWDSKLGQPIYRGYQNKKLAPDTIKQILVDRSDSAYPILVCGKLSHDLEVIDIDEKNYKGISVKFINAIKEEDSDLLRRLRIHKTKNNGFHLLYRCVGLTDEDWKHKLLASFKYEEVDEQTGEITTKYRTAIETRGDGQLAIIPPFPGYKIVRDVEIPLITMEERKLLFSIASTLDQKVIDRNEGRHSSEEGDKGESIYAPGDNPFEQFNKSNRAKTILEDNGWKLYKDTSRFTHYTRPGKDTGTSAVYMKDINCYYIFTSSTNLDPDKTLDPSALLCALKYGNDYKPMYQNLVEKGYGVIKPEIEKKMIQKSVKTGSVPPPNISADAVKKIDKAQSVKSSIFKYGEFWEFTNKGKIVYLRNRLIDVATSLGLRRWNNQPVILKEKFYFERIRDKSEILFLFRKYLNEKYWRDNELIADYESLFNTHDSYMEAHMQQLILNLPAINEKDILRDTYSTAYAVTPETVKIISKKQIYSISISDINGKRLKGKDRELYDKHIKGKYIDIDSIQPIEWEYIPKEESDDSKWAQFIDIATAINVNIVQNILGYMAYDYRSSSESYFVCLIDEKEAKDGGGTGKGVTSSMLNYWTRTSYVSGTTIDKDFSLLLQSWNGERIVAIDDLTKYSFLHQFKSAVSKGMTWKRLFKDIVELSLHDSPKIILDGQFGLDIFTDGGVKRRAVVIPYSGEVFSGVSGKSVDEYFGGEFPDCWTQDDWNGFYSWMVDAIRIYMGNRKISRLETGTEKAWKKSFDYTYDKYGGEVLRTWVLDNIPAWREQTIENGGFTYEDLRKDYSKYLSDNGISYKMRVSRLHDAIADILKHEGYNYERLNDREISGTYGRVRYQKVYKIGEEVENKPMEDDLPF